MKRIIIITFVVINLLILGLSSYAQPDPGSGNGGSPVGGGAPIGSGLLSLLCCGISYLLIKFYKTNKKSK